MADFTKYLPTIPRRVTYPNAGSFYKVSALNTSFLIPDTLPSGVCVGFVLTAPIFLLLLSRSSSSSSLSSVQSTLRKTRAAHAVTVADIQSRHSKDLSSSSSRSSSKILKSLLPALDSLSAASSEKTATPEQLTQGIALTRTVLLAGFAAHGVHPLPITVTSPFDPTKMEAMTMVPGGVAKTVAVVYREGYEGEEGVVRAGQVGVFDGKSEGGER